MSLKKDGFGRLLTDIETNTQVTLAPQTAVQLESSPTAILGSIATTAEQRYEKWSIPQISLSNTFTTVWQKTQNDIAFYSALFHISTDKMWIRVEVDGTEIMNCDIEELKDDFKLSSDGGSSSGGGASGARFGIREYASKRWEFMPLIPIRVATDITIQMRSHSGNKTLYRGLSVWGPR